MLDTRQIYSISDFVRSPKAHVARMKETGNAEVLTVNGRAELVVLDAESYEKLMEHVRNMETIARTRAKFAQTRANLPNAEPITEEEISRRQSVMMELVTETERLGLYK